MYVFNDTEGTDWEQKNKIYSTIITRAIEDMTATMMGKVLIDPPRHSGRDIPQAMQKMTRHNAAGMQKKSISHIGMQRT